MSERNEPGGASRLRAQLEQALARDAGIDDPRFLPGLIHDPAWRPALERAIADLPGGATLVVSLGCAEHAAAFSVARGRPVDAAPRVTADEAIALAEAGGAHVAALRPYGVLCVDEIPNAWLSAMPGYPPAARERLLSWIAADEQLAGFARFVESAVAASAPAIVCAAWLIAFAPGPSPDDHAGVRARAGRRHFALDTKWSGPLRSHFADEPTRALAATLLVRSGAWAALGPARSTLDGLAGGFFSRVAAGIAADEDLLTRQQAWTASLEPGAFAYAGVDLRGVFDADIRAELQTPSA